MRWIATVMLVGLTASIASPAPALPAGRSSASLYVRGVKDLDAVLATVGSDLADPGRPGAPLLVVLVDPAPLVASAAGGMGPALSKLGAGLPDGSRVIVAVVDGEPPDLEGEPLDPVAACRDLAAHPQPGVRNLLGAVRRVAKRYRTWEGPKDILLLATDGTSGEEETEETLALLERYGFRFSVVAGEAAFARPWNWSPPRPPGFLVRLTGHPDQRRDTLYPACDVPFPDAPTHWDASLAPNSLRLKPGHKYTTHYVLPSGFGYYHLARLASRTGGRYFLHGFARGKGALALSYDYGLLRLFEPDLRSRSEILLDLPRHTLAAAIYRIWGRLAEPSVGVVRRYAPVSTDGPGGRLRGAEEAMTSPNRILKFWFSGKGDTVWVVDTLRQRLVAVDAALVDLETAARAHALETRGRIRTEDHRWIAMIDLLRLQLLRVRFHMGEILATLEDLRAADFHNEMIVVSPRTLFRGSVPVPGEPIPAEPVQIRHLHEALGETERMEESYAGTPWGYMAELGELFTYVITTYEKGGSRPIVRARSSGREKTTPPPKPKPATPGSSGAGTATGGD